MRDITHFIDGAAVAGTSGLHGDVFALSGGSFSGEVGTAFFALPAAGGGRRVDVELRLVP